MNVSPIPLLIASIGGIIPALIWLWFWLHEDSRRPEPRGRIALTFIAGMLAVIIVLPLERFTQQFFSTYSLGLLFTWASIEEIVKFALAWIAALHARVMDEPLDAVIYMITAALGFAALENVLFLLNPMGNGLWIETIVTGNLRFVGASVLHTLASGILGASIGFAFYRKKTIRKRAILRGLILAIALHTLFNFLIIKSTGNGMLMTFGFVWVGIIGLLLLIEKIKTVRPVRNNIYF